jgi:hypothetical protein
MSLAVSVATQKIWQGFSQLHLQGRQEDKGDWLSFVLGENVCKIVLFANLTIHPPEAILYIPLCHKYLGVVLGLGKGMDDPAEGIPQLVKGFLWSHFNRGGINRVQ